MRVWGPRLAGVMTGLLFGLFAAAAQSVLIPSPAVALPKPACWTDNPRSGDDYGTVQAYELQVGSSGGLVIQDSLSGIRSNVRVTGDPPTCGHINSLGVFDTNEQYLFEFGWFEGWINCFGTTGDYVHYTRPTLFAVGIGVGGVKKCRFFSTNVTASAWHLMRSSDKNEDNRWGGWYEGTELQPDDQGWVLGFHQGHGWVNMEREKSDDPGFAHFTGIDEVINDGWSPTDHMTTDPSISDHDPDYKSVITGGDDVEFRHE